MPGASLPWDGILREDVQLQISLLQVELYTFVLRPLLVVVVLHCFCKILHIQYLFPVQIK